MKNKSKKNRIIALALAVLSAAMIFTACAKANAEEPADGENVQDVNEKRDSIVIAVESEPTTLNPYDHAAVVSGYMNQLTYNKLFRIDIDTLEPVPDLVESYENLDDSTWVFHLKQGVMFHNGEEMTAEDVKASMEYARNFVSSSKYTSFWTGIEVVDTYTVKITTDGAYALILNDLAANGNTIVPKSLIDAGNDFNENPIGTGPYIFKEWVLGDSLTFVKNENYFDKDHMPTITDMTWRVIPEGSSRTIALETGEVDLIMDVDSTDAQRLSETEGIVLDSTPGTRMNFMALNNEKEDFSNVLVRRAINCLIDKQAVIEVSANGQGEASVAMNPDVYDGISDEGAGSFDVGLAMELFEQAGVDPTGISFSCMCYTDATRRAAEVIQGCLSEVGITMEIETLDFAAFLSKLLEGDFEAGIAGYTSSDVLTYMRGLWHTSSINATNSARISSAEIDSLIDEAMATLDVAARTELVSRINLLVNEACPIVPLYTSTYLRAYDADLGGVNVSASGNMIFSDLCWN